MSNTATFSPPARTLPSPLRLRRLTLGLTQAGLAEAAGLSREQVARLEVGECEPRLSTIKGLARALGCDATVIFPFNDEGASTGRLVEESAEDGDGHESEG